jgi:parvulin-like peptidyl-prolyl isomerase
MERYRSEPTVTLDELVLNDNGEITEELTQLFAAGTGIEELSNQFDSSAGSLPGVTRTDMNNIFEVDFARQVFAAQINQWVGPFISNRGQHWLQLKSRTDAELPPLAEITDLVRLDWIAQEEENRLQIEIDKLLKSYSILINEDAGLL